MNKDLLTGVKDAIGNTCRYEYTENGKLFLFEDLIGSITKLNYNEMNKIKDFTLPDGENFKMEYDLCQKLTKEIHPDGGDVDHKGIKEDKNKEKIIHKLWEDSSTFYYEYDSLSRLVAVKRGEKEVCRYAYDAFGNRSKMKKDGIEVAYTYDALDRLVNINSLHTNESYEYDKRGNLIGVTDRGKKIKAYEYGALGRLGLSYSNLGKARSYEYDGIGNRIGCREYKFESKGLGEDRLKSINELDLAKKEPVYEERYVLDRTRPYNNMLQRSILDRGKEQTQSYSWDFNAVFMEEEEKVYTYLNDELGSTIRLLEKEGKSQTIYGYDEFGKDTYGTQGQVQPFGYTGYRYDAVAGTYFAQAREYVPGVGRFGGEDWIKGSISYPTSLNAYGYCHGNPLVWVDRDGLHPVATSIGVPKNNIIDWYIKLYEKGKKTYDQQRIDMPAPAFPPRDSSMPDYTNGINEWLYKKEADFQNSRSKWGDEITLIRFYNEVKTGGPMDIKERKRWNEAFNTDNMPFPNGFFVYNNQVMDAGTLGNITYGYIGTSLGYPPEILYYGGGFANVKNMGTEYFAIWPLLPNYGDAPEDIKAIRDGIDLYNSTHKRPFPFVPQIPILLSGNFDCKSIQ